MKTSTLKRVGYSLAAVGCGWAGLLLCCGSHWYYAAGTVSFFVWAVQYTISAVKGL